MRLCFSFTLFKWVFYFTKRQVPGKGEKGLVLVLGVNVKFVYNIENLHNQVRQFHLLCFSFTLFKWVFYYTKRQVPGKGAKRKWVCIDLNRNEKQIVQAKTIGPWSVDSLDGGSADVIRAPSGRPENWLNHTILMKITTLKII